VKDLQSQVSTIFLKIRRMVVYLHVQYQQNAKLPPHELVDVHSDELVQFFDP